MKLPSDISDSSPGKRKSLTVTIIKYLCLSAGLILVGWFIVNSNLSNIYFQLRAININFIFLLMVTLFAYFLVSTAWYLSFNDRPGHINLWDMFIIRLIGESLAQINPTNVIAGEALKAVLMKRKGVPLKKGVASITISRFLIVLSSVTLIFLGAVFLIDALNLSGNRMIIMFITITFVLFAIIALLKTGKGVLFLPIFLLHMLEKRIKQPKKITQTIAHMVEIDRELIDFYRYKKSNFIFAYILSLLSWIAGAGEFYLILYFLGLEQSFISCIIIEIGVMVFKAMGAFVPGQIGVEEFATKKMLEVTGVAGSEVWITVAILRRTRQIFWIAVGFIAFLLVMRKTKGVDNGSVVYNS